MGKIVVSETTGRAREYAERAVNLYNGCTHGCTYCYVTGLKHITPAMFHKEATPRLTRAELAEGIGKTYGDTRPVLLCFDCDPYQPAEEDWKLTRATIELLHQYGVPVIILTKAGKLAQRDLDILRPDFDEFAVTLTTAYFRRQEMWEPNAGSYTDRLSNLRAAHDAGIKTWVSLEPIISPRELLILIEDTAEFVHHYKIGPLNHHNMSEDFDYKAIGAMVTTHLDRMGKPYYLKQDMRYAMGIAGANGWYNV